MSSDDSSVVILSFILRIMIPSVECSNQKKLGDEFQVGGLNVSLFFVLVVNDGTFELSVS